MSQQLTVFQDVKEDAASITFTHRWIIDHIGPQKTSWKWPICSNHFSPVENDEFVFFIRLQLKNNQNNLNDDKQNLKIALFASTIPINLSDKILMNWKWSIVDENGVKWYTRQMGGAFTSRESNDISEDIQLEKLLETGPEEEVDGYLPKDKLILDFEITLTHISSEPVFTTTTTTSPNLTQSDVTAPVVALSHTFTIEKFKCMIAMKKNTPLWIESNYFEPENKLFGAFCIAVYPNGKETTADSEVEILIFNENTVNANVHYAVSLVDETGNGCNEQENEDRLYPTKGIGFRFPHQLILDHHLLPSSDHKLTIRCELHVMIDDLTQLDSKLPNTKYFPKNQITSVSTFDISQYCLHQANFTWNINHFMSDFFNNKRKTQIKSDLFTSDTSAKYSFSLHLYPKGIDKSNSDYIVVRLVSIGTIERPTTIQYRFVFGTNGKIWKECVYNDDIFKQTNLSPISLLHHEALKQLSDTLLPNDTLTISCEVWILEKRQQNAASKKLLPEIPKMLNSTIPHC